MPEGTISVVPIGNKICKPFLLEVMVFSPESGYKFKVMVERSCTPEADEMWKLVFDLYKVTPAGKETQLVHVSYTTMSAVEQQAVRAMASDGINASQAGVLVEEVHPAAKAVVGKKKPTPAQKKKVKDAMAKVVNIE